jgi:hypothetical protein
MYMVFCAKTVPRFRYLASSISMSRLGYRLGSGPRATVTTVTSDNRGFTVRVAPTSGLYEPFTVNSDFPHAILRSKLAQLNSWPGHPKS